jgi:hydroxymethylpyrimidine kinase/phosphomethylpyrimidine kinase
VVLTIAGLDPSGGAGVIADIRTFEAFGCFSTAAITSLTFQNANEVSGAEHVSAATLRAELMPIIREHRIAAAKTGMLPTREIVKEVARHFRENDLPAPVVDPVIRSTSGYRLIDDDALAALVKELLPLARLITPNIPEAEQITGLRIVDEEGMRRAAQAIRELGARAVLIKGGHLWKDEGGTLELRVSRQLSESPKASGEAIDVLDNEGAVTVFRSEWINGGVLRGTGCMLSAAIAACLANGWTLEDSVIEAKRFVAIAIGRRRPINFSLSSSS